MSKYAIISSSFRGNSNSYKICKALEEALSLNNEVKLINLVKVEMNFCLGCGYCEHNKGVCIRKDSLYLALDSIRDYDYVIFASPMYYGEICGQLKTCFDRMNSVIQNNSIKKMALICSCAGPLEEKSIIKESFNIFVDNFKSCKNQGVYIYPSAFMPNSFANDKNQEGFINKIVSDFKEE